MTTNAPSDNKAYQDSLNFLLEKCKDRKTPLNIENLKRKYKEKGASAQEGCFWHDESYRHIIPNMKNCDTETKVKIMFALGIPVPSKFSEELIKNKDHVKLDYFHRIVEYKKSEGGFELKGKHIFSKYTRYGVEEPILRFLAKKAERSDKPIQDEILMKSFQKESQYKTDCEPISSLLRRYSIVKRRIYKSDEFSEKTKIKMLFVSNAEINNKDLIKLRENADVEVDSNNCIILYKANDGSFDLKKNRTHAEIIQAKYVEVLRTLSHLIAKNSSKEDLEAVKFTSFSSETSRLITFATKECQKVESFLGVTELCRDYQKRTGCPLSTYTLCSKIYKFRKHIHQMNGFETETKVKMIFYLQAVVDKPYLTELRKRASVDVDKANRIIRYTSFDECLKLDRNQKKPASSRKRKFGRYSRTDSDEDDSCDVTEITPVRSRYGRLCGKRRYIADTSNDQKMILTTDTTEKENQNTDDRLAASSIVPATNQTVTNEDETEVNGCNEKERENAEGTKVVIAEKSPPAEIDKTHESLSIRIPASIIKRVSTERFCTSIEKKVREKLIDRFDVSSEEANECQMRTTGEKDSSKIQQNPVPMDSEDVADQINSSNIEEDLTNEDLKGGSSSSISDEPIVSSSKETDRNVETTAEKKVQESTDLFQLDDENVDLNITNLITSTPLKTNQNDDSFKFPLTPATLQNQLDNFDEDLFDLSFSSVTHQIEPDDYALYLRSDQLLESTSLYNQENIGESQSIHSSFTIASSSEEENYIALVKVLESFHSLIVALDFSNLAELQTKLEKKIEEIRGRNEMIPTTGILHCFELCLLMLNKKATEILTTNEEMPSFKEFIGYLRHTIITIKIPILDSFQLKLKNTIGALRVNDKKVSAESIKSVLQLTLHNIMAL